MRSRLLAQMATKPVFLLVIVLLSAFCAAAFAANLRKSPTFGYMASLEYKNQHICGAAIIDDFTALTAAHCVHNRSVGDLTLRISTLHRENGGLTVLLQSVAVHPGFNSANYDYDIAMLQSQSALHLIPFTQPAILPPHGSKFEGSDAYIVGWGADGIENNFTPRLMYASVKLQPSKVCKKYVASTERTMCAIDTVHSTCRGDAGGPVVVDGILAGVISDDRACAQPDKAMLFTKVAPFLDWITENNFTE